MTTTHILWAIATYFIAAIPYSLIIGFVFLKVDIREFGDGNPGATNVKRASGSTGWFLLALFFDGMKGLFPIGIPYWLMGWTGTEIIIIALAAICGHAFSIFMGFRGGKAVAVTSGVWIGLTIVEYPLFLSVMLVYWFKSVDSSDWTIVLFWISWLLYLLISHTHNTAFLAVWTGNFLILLVRHRHGLNRLPRIKRWLPLLSPNTPHEVQASTS